MYVTLEYNVKYYFYIYILFECEWHFLLVIDRTFSLIQIFHSIQILSGVCFLLFFFITFNLNNGALHKMGDDFNLMVR